MQRRPASDATLEVAVRGAGRSLEIDGAALRGWLEELVRSIAPQAASLGVRFCGDRAMRAMNRDFRGRDEVTDVLSFPGGDALEPGPLGDVVVCVAPARRQAQARGVSLRREIETLLLQGVLHCQGFDHETDHGEMQRLERRLRRRWVNGE
jgi:probable rRNA maturation factor